jgi:hypothetical protein
METHTPISFQNPDIQALYAGMALRMQETLRDALHDPIFLNHLAEEIADRLDGFEDRALAAAIDEALQSPVVSEDDVMKELKS